MKKLLITAQTIGLMALTAVPALAAKDTIEVPKVGPVNIGDLGYLIGAIMGILLIIAAIAAFLFLILGGLQWITSGGDKAGLEAARNKITNAIVGLIIVAAAWAVMFLVGRFLGLENLFQGGLNIPVGYSGTKSPN